jgi:hypothetical protein
MVKHQQPKSQLTPADPAAQCLAVHTHRGGRRTLLTDELQAKIVTSIRNGAWDYVAAEANGIDRQTFWEWIRRGEGIEQPDRPQTRCYAKFAKSVREARAQSRMRAEIKVSKTEPLKYLTYGPGRDRPGAPGWTNGLDGSGVAQSSTVVNVLVQPMWIEMRTALLQALESYPEARAIVAQVLAQVTAPSSRDDGSPPTE